MNKVEGVVKNLGKVISKNGPHILTGLGCAGVLSTAILTGKATPHAMEILKDERKYRKKNHFVEMKPLDKFKLTWQCYIPAGVVGITSIGCIIGANTINTRRNAALAALYTLSETAFRDYKTKVVEQLGKTKDVAIKDGVAKDYVTKHPVSDDSNLILVGDGEILCIDKPSGRPFKSNYETVRKVFNDLDWSLRGEMWLDLNELYFALGLDPIELGNLMGFDIEKGPIELIPSTQLDKKGRPCLVIDYDVYPKYIKR